ncbi:MAG: hypothetical protein ACRCXC_07160 [Legionella sp.]
MPFSLRKSFFQLLNSDLYKDRLSITEKENLARRYRDQIGLSSQTNFGAKAIEDYVGKKVKDHTGFSLQIGASKEDTLEKLLKGDDSDKPKIRAKFQEIFALDPDFEIAKKKYEASIAEFNNLVKKVPTEYSIEDLKDALAKANANAETAIKAQQELERKKLKDYLEGPDFKTQFKGTFGIDEAKAKEVKTSLTKELETKHAAQLKTFDNNRTANATKLDKASNLEMERVVFSAQLQQMTDQLSEKDRVKMQKEINDAKEKYREMQGLDSLAPKNTKAIVNVNKKKSTIHAFDPKDLGFIKSITGREITHDKKSDTWSISMPHRILSPFYYGSNKEKPKVDMLLMAHAIKESGYKQIEMTIDFPDEKTRKKRARQAYEACLESGFDPKDITLVDGDGKKIEPGDIFTRDELATRHKNAAATREKIDNLVKNTSPTKSSAETQMRMKGDLESGRTKHLDALAKKSLLEKESLAEKRLDDIAKSAPAA